MRTPARWLTLVAAFLGVTFQAGAEKKEWVKVYHAATLPVLAGSRVVFGQVSGDCARELAGLLAADLALHKIGVVSPEELAGLPPGIPVVKISVDVSRCQSLPVPPIIGSGMPAVHISRTEGRILATIRVVDLASGAELAAEPIRAEAKKENQAQTGQPEWPGAPEVKELTLRQAVADAQHLYLPWLETREVVFMDDKECNLKAAFELLHTGDYEKVAAVARASAEGCKANAKVAAGAWYNLGVAYMLVRKYDQALAALAASQKLHESKAAAEIVAACQQSKATAEAEARRMAAQAPKPSEGEVQTGILLTNDFIVKLVEGNVAEEEILKMIASQPARFSLAPDDVLKLKQAGVSDSILAAMRGKK
ncbi:MAG: hypothetical protein ABSH46_01015 [Bryobacteraceae bacterium]|jgi:hypothetical protein